VWKLLEKFFYDGGDLRYVASDGEKSHELYLVKRASVNLSKLALEILLFAYNVMMD
jgi:hypothetical protein